ncbi:MAG: hypothetical protein JO063_10465 [Pseudonocardiales bacterium]|nr:hypothetical protein [Pseudonocardiales bacterium]
MQPTPEEKVRERRLRRAALRKGLHLRKSRMLDPDDSEFGMWWVVASPVDHPQDWRWLGRELTSRGGITFDEVGVFVAAYGSR